MRGLVVGLLALAVIGAAWGVAGPSSGGADGPDSAAEYIRGPVEHLLDNAARVEWSEEGTIYFDRRGADGFFDAWRVNPDGTGEVCLTCNHPSLPTRHVGNPESVPGGRYLMLQVEKAVHDPVPTWLPEPGIGRFNDLWVLDLQTTAAYQLTNVSPSGASGVLHHHSNDDGTRMFWTQVTGTTAEFDDLAIVVADFVTTPTPHLENHAVYNPGPDPTWMEAHGWGPDDEYVYFACTPLTGMSDGAMDICRMDFANPTQATRLTQSSGLNGEAAEWDEHAHLSPNDDVFVWITTDPYGAPPGDVLESFAQMKSDLWLMNEDGSGARRMTFFNEPGEPDYQGSRAIVSDVEWNAYGTKMVMRVQFPDSAVRDRIFLMDLCSDADDDGACGVRYARTAMAEVAEGGLLDWSADGSTIYYDHLEPDGFYDVWEMEPDGSDTSCLSCGHPDLPNRNQGNPVVSPDGRYLVFQGEMETHAAVPTSFTEPGFGRFNDLWALDLQTDEAWQLTSVASNGWAGTLQPEFSNDGSQLMWGQLEGQGTGGLNDWALMVADWVTAGGPHLQNAVAYNPGPQPGWLEVQGWGPDDSWIYFTCTPLAGMPDSRMDTCRMDFSAPGVVTRLNLTSGLNGEAAEWEDHSELSPAGDVYAYISTEPYSISADAVEALLNVKTDLWLMNADGSGRQRITYFNEPGHADYTGVRTVVSEVRWSPSGDRLAVRVQTPSLPVRNHIYIVEFDVDSDGDGLLNGVDICWAWANPAQQLPLWPVPGGDGDCDGFTQTVEAYLGTDAVGHCAATATANDEPTPDAWPADFDDNQLATTLDLVAYVTALNTAAGNPNYVQRADLNANGSITTLDLVGYVTMLNKGCAA